VAAVRLAKSFITSLTRLPPRGRFMMSSKVLLLLMIWISLVVQSESVTVSSDSMPDSETILKRMIARTNQSESDSYDVSETGEHRVVKDQIIVTLWGIDLIRL